MKLETIADAYPLSPMQQGMLFHHLSARQPGVDIEQILCILREAIDTAAFERAWQRAVERHAILRTGFRWEDGDGPQQVVHGEVLLHFENKDWRGLAQHDQKDRFEACLQAERAGGFDLNVPPLMRLVLCRNGEAEYRLIWTFHHLLLDGRAVAALLNEVFAIYEALASGGDLELPPPCPYRDYITWLQNQDLSQAEQCWRENLKGFTAATPLVAGKNGGEPPHAFVAADVSRRTTPQGKLAPTDVGGYEG